MNKNDNKKIKMPIIALIILFVLNIILYFFIKPYYTKAFPGSITVPSIDESDFVGIGEKITTTKTAISKINKPSTIPHKDIRSIKIEWKKTNKSPVPIYYYGDEISSKDITVKGLYSDGNWEEISDEDLDFIFPSRDDMFVEEYKDIIVKYQKKQSVIAKSKVRVCEPTIKINSDTKDEFIATAIPECNVDWYFFEQDEYKCSEKNNRKATALKDFQTPVIASIEYNGHRYFSKPFSHNMNAPTINLNDITRDAYGNISFEALSNQICKKYFVKKLKFEVYWFGDNFDGAYDKNYIRKYSNWTEFLNKNQKFIPPTENGLLVILVKHRNKCIDYCYKSF